MVVIVDFSWQPGIMNAVQPVVLVHAVWHSACVEAVFPAMSPPAMVLPVVQWYSDMSAFSRAESRSSRLLLTPTGCWMLHDECSCKSDSIEIVQIEPSVYSKSRFCANVVDAKAAEIRVVAHRCLRLKPPD